MLDCPLTRKSAPNGGKPPGDIPLRQIIARELAAAQASRAGLMSRKEPRRFQLFILACCILTNLIFYLTRGDYLALFVAASFYLNMFYFLTLLIPTNPGTADLRAPEIAKFHAWLRENGITSGTRQFTRIFINTFFMNCRTLTLGIGLVLSVDIIYTLLAFTRPACLWISLSLSSPSRLSSSSFTTLSPKSNPLPQSLQIISTA